MPRVLNREQRRAIENNPLSISELQRALDRLEKGVVPGVDGLPAEAYQRLTLPVKRRLAARLWDIVTGATPIPPEWANLVHPLYKKGGWAQPGNCRPIVCATTEVKLVWTLILGRIAPAVFAHVPASMWGAMAGRSPHEDIFLQDTEADSDPCGHLGVTWGVYLCADKPPFADIILSHPPDLTRCDSVRGLAIPAMSGHIQYRGAASGDLYIRISGINRVLLS